LTSPNDMLPVHIVETNMIKTIYSLDLINSAVHLYGV
jgi:multisubunit Na+/H+ antiporter MnhC subunit